MKTYQRHLINLISFIALWFLLYDVINHPLILPSPISVFETTFELLIDKDSLYAIGMTFLRLVIIISVISLLALSLGFILGKRKQIELLLRPWLTGIKAIPIISIVIIILIIFGQTLAPWMITFMVTFPIIYQATLEGMHHMDQDLLDVFYMEDARFFESIKHVYLPLLKKHIMLALLQSVSLGLKVLIMAEYFAQSRYSIGRSLFMAKASIQYDLVFAWTIIIVICALIIETIIYKVQHHLED